MTQGTNVDSQSTFGPLKTKSILIRKHQSTKGDDNSLPFCVSAPQPQYIYIYIHIYTYIHMNLNRANPKLCVPGDAFLYLDTPTDLQVPPAMFNTAEVLHPSRPATDSGLDDRVC